jgi:hypothetical protein
MKQPLLLLWVLAAGCARYAWQSLKNGVKSCLGRKPYFDHRLAFFPQCILHLTGLRPMRAITCLSTSGYEGAGIQAHMVMNAINLARACGLAYVHTPFVNIGHADRPMHEWIAVWESLFNLGHGEPSCGLAESDVFNYRNCSGELELYLGWRNRREELTRRFMALIPEFRDKYYREKSPRISDDLTVAVHIRRGDVSPDNPLFTNTNQVVQAVGSVRSILDAHKAACCIRVYSEGAVADFAELSPFGVQFSLDADPLWTMQELIEADILIMSKSSFSYYAGIISDGIKIFEPRDVSPQDREFFPSLCWPHLYPTDDWLPCQKDGSIDPAALDRQLSILLQTKRNARSVR